jgi:uncharacterized protein
MHGLPPSAAWRHVEARSGFEVVFFRAEVSGLRVEGRTVAVEDEQPWSVGFSVTLDRNWTTRAVRVCELARDGRRDVRLETDASGRWRVNGVEDAALDDCVDVDLGASAFTNTLPIRRLRIDHGDPVPAPAAYVRAPGLSIERLDQIYTRLPALDGLRRYAYTAPAFGFEAELIYDEHDLVLDYPGIATRVA